MRLDVWMVINHVKLKDIAEFIGTSKSVVSLIKNGKFIPSKAVCLCIEFLTKGEVTREDLGYKGIKPRKGYKRKKPFPKKKEEKSDSRINCLLLNSPDVRLDD